VPAESERLQVPNERLALLRLAATSGGN